MFNRVTLVGRVCTDPEMKYTPSGVAVSNFRIAVDRPFSNAQGERETDFIDVVVWRQGAEFVNTYFTKGRLVLIDGRLQVRQWQTPDGQRRRNAEVVAEVVRLLDRPREGGPQPTQPRADAPAEAPPMSRFSGGGVEIGGVHDEHPSQPPADMPDFDTAAADIPDPFADQ